MTGINSFIFSFRKYQKRIGKILFVLLLCLGMKLLLDFLYVNYDDSQWVRIIWREFYREEDIDNLYLGSSHVYCDLNPYLLDELNGENNFSLSTSAQRLNGSYYLLKEADKRNSLSHVYLELNYELATGKEGEFKNPDNLMANWWNVDYMHFSFNKLEYMFSMCRKENYPETLLPFLRYKARIFDLKYIREQVNGKRQEHYQNYEFSNTNEQGQVIEFYERGYWYITRELSQSSLLLMQKDTLQDKPLTEDAETYLRKIIEYCEERQIELTLFSAPVYELDLLAAGNYDVYVKQINQIADEYQVEYHDFNLCKEEVLPLQSTDNFWDTIHLNSKGADIFTRVFFEVMQNGKGTYFHDTFEQKLTYSTERVYGLTYSNNAEDRKVEVASNRGEGLEYKIMIISENGLEEVIQDYSSNKEFTIPYDTKGRCKIEVRKIGQNNPFQSMEIVY